MKPPTSLVSCSACRDRSAAAPSTWSLSYEMFFYLAAAALLLDLGVARMPPRLRVAILLLLGSAFVALAWLVFPTGPFACCRFTGMLLAEGLGKRVPPWAGWAGVTLGCVIPVTHALSRVPNDLAQSVAFFLLCTARLQEAQFPEA